MLKKPKFPTHVQKLLDKYEKTGDKNIWKDVCGKRSKHNFQFGDCAAFAVALHREYGLKIHMVGDCHHLFCSTPDGYYVDSLGVLENKVKGPSDSFCPPHVSSSTWAMERPRRVLTEAEATKFIWDKHAVDEAMELITTLPEFLKLKRQTTTL